jgi:hypothetical protein
MTEEAVLEKEVAKEEVKTEDKPIKFFVAVPSYDRRISVPCVQSLMNALQVFQLNQIQFEFKFEVGLCWISMARNSLARAFMESDCTDMIFIDDDIGFPPFAFRDLISSGEEVIAGVYPKKEADEVYAALLKTTVQGNLVVENGLIEADGLPTGFMKIKRSVFEKMQAAYPELVYMDTRYGKKTYNFFGEFIRDGRWFGDDYGFCQRWREIGGRLWALPNITFIHQGNKNYEGNLHQFLSRPQQMGKFLPGEKEGPAWISKPSAKE